MVRSRASLHLALFPFPLQGHITPMMQLASLLHSRGFSITIVHAHFNAPDPRNHPHFRFESFADGIDPDLVAGMGIIDQVYTIIAHCEQPLVSLMKRIQSGDEFVDCIVSDSLYSGGRVAGELGLPWVVLRTNSPTSFMLSGSFVLLHQLGYLPVKGTRTRMGRSRASLHLALFPFPLQGHITPMMQLASLLHSRGFSITIVHAHFNAPDPRNHPHFRFESFSDGIDPDLVADMGIMDLVYTIIAHCEQPLVSLMKRIQSSDEFVDCIVSDSMYSSWRVAGELGLPWVVLRTNSLNSMMVFGSFALLHQLGYLPLKDPEAMIKELPPFRVKDLPLVGNDQSERFFKTVAALIDSTLKSSAILMNSFDKLEEPALDWIRSRTQAPVFLLGPLCAASSSINPGSLFRQDRSCLTWLDRHAHGSVIYISIGSLATMGPAELVEMAQGLGDCQHPFLWVIRPGSVKSEELVRFLNRFALETEDRGCMVKWAPQTEVLAHPAVGAFMSHCGWNSTLESMCAGKPMLCWPAFGDQKVNARMICHVWGNGMEMGEKLESERIKNSVKELMMGEKEGKEIREKARLLQELALSSLKVGGPSYTAVNELKAYISSFNSSSLESN